MRAAAVPARSRRAAAAAAAPAAAAGLLAGCTGGGGPAAAGHGGPGGAAEPAVASPAAATAPAGDLARGLLPADAFGPGATVLPVTLAQLQQRLAAVPGGLPAALAGVQVTPEGCATALQQLGAGLPGLSGLAAEGARTGGGVTAEALLTGTPVAAGVPALQGLTGACSWAQITSPHGTAAITLTPVPLTADGTAAPGDAAAAVAATAVLTRTGSAPVTVSGLLAAVRDGDRLLLVGTAAPGATAPDRASFTSLVQRAFNTESHALG